MRREKVVRWYQGQKYRYRPPSGRKNKKRDPDRFGSPARRYDRQTGPDRDFFFRLKTSVGVRNQTYDPSRAISRKKISPEFGPPGARSGPTVKPFRGDEKPVSTFSARNVPGHRGNMIGTPPGLDGGFTRPLGAIAVVVDRQKLKTGRRHVPFRGGAGRPARREVRIRPSRNRPNRIIG